MKNCLFTQIVHVFATPNFLINCCEHKNWLILNIDAISILFQDEDLTPEQIAGEFNSMRLNR